jgi:phage gp16-like protein
VRPALSGVPDRAGCIETKRESIMARQTDGARHRLIALAHLAAKQAGADEATRRAVQRKLTGVDSCAQMDVAALQTVIRYWQRHGASVRLPGPLVKASDERAPLMRKIAAQCHAQGLPFPAYPLGVVQRMLGHAVERIEWVPAPVLRDVVAALEYHRRRKDARG